LKKSIDLNTRNLFACTRRNKVPIIEKSTHWSLRSILSSGAVFLSIKLITPAENCQARRIKIRYGGREKREKTKRCVILIAQITVRSP